MTLQTKKELDDAGFWLARLMFLVLTSGDTSRRDRLSGFKFVSHLGNPTSCFFVLCCELMFIFTFFCLLLFIQEMVPSALSAGLEIHPHTRSMQ